MIERQQITGVITNQILIKLFKLNYLTARVIFYLDKEKWAMSKSAQARSFTS